MAVGGSGEDRPRGHSDSRDLPSDLVFPERPDPQSEARQLRLSTGAVFHSNLRKMTSAPRWPITQEPQCGGTEYETHDRNAGSHRALEDGPFLEGAHHKVRFGRTTKNTRVLMTAKKLNRRQARWSLYRPRFTSPCITGPGRSMASPTLYLARADHGTEQGTTAMSRYSARSSSQLTQSEPSPDYHWKKKSAISFGDPQGKPRGQAGGHSREVRHGNSGGPRESLSERRSGRSTMDSLFSGTESTYLMIRKLRRRIASSP